MTTDDRPAGSGQSFALSEELREEIFNEQILPERFAQLLPVKNPIVFFLGGQPGAGKTALQSVIERDRGLSGGASGLAEIGPDLFRTYHPRYLELAERDDQRTSFHTNVDAGAWVKRAIALTRQIGSNVVLEGTLRQPQVTIETAQGYGEQGFTAELHVPITHEYVSRLYIIRRYLGQLQESGHGRYTIRSAHDSAYVKLPESLSVIAKSRSMARIVLHGPDHQVLLNVDGGGGNAAEALRSVIDEARRGPHLEPEAIHGELAQLEPIAVELDRQECLRDIRGLRADLGG